MPGKTYKIGEAAQLLKLKSYVLRFWETEFPQLNPLRTESGQRLYSEQDLALLGRIRQLLHERGLTIEGARKVLSDLPPAEDELSSTMLSRGYSDDYFENDAESESETPIARQGSLEYNYPSTSSERFQNSPDHAANTDELHKLKSALSASEAKIKLQDELLRQVLAELSVLRANLPKSPGNSAI